MLDDKKYIKRAVQLAYEAVAAGDTPFGSLLVDEQGNILIEGKNTQNVDNDISAHSEMNVIKKAAKLYDRDFLSRCTLYNSGEPCTMCAGAIFWSGIKRVVYGISKDEVDKINNNLVNIKYNIHELFADIDDVEIVGPMEDMYELVVGPHLKD